MEHLPFVARDLRNVFAHHNVYILIPSEIFMNSPSGQTIVSTFEFHFTGYQYTCTVQYCRIPIVAVHVLRVSHDLRLPNKITVRTDNFTGYQHTSTVLVQYCRIPIVHVAVHVLAHVHNE
jgi:hypothetical protein